jgi:hypothetical protein
MLRVRRTQKKELQLPPFFVRPCYAVSMESFIAAIFQTHDAAIAAHADLQRQVNAGSLDIDNAAVYERNAAGELDLADVEAAFPPSLDVANLPGGSGDEALSELDAALPASDHVLLIHADDGALPGIEAIVEAHDGTIVRRSQSELQSDAYKRFIDSTSM